MTGISSEGTWPPDPVGLPTLFHETGGQLDMGGPAKLADRLYPFEAIAAIHQHQGVARESARIAGDISDPRHRRGGEQRHLLLRTRAGRVEHDRLEAA